MIIPLFPEIPPCIRFISLEEEYDPPFPEVLYNLENLQLFLLSNLAMTLGQILQTKNGKYSISGTEANDLECTRGSCAYCLRLCK